jgi:hypothetical protein
MNHRLAFIAIALGTPATAAEPGLWKACTIETTSLCTQERCSPRKPEISIFVSHYRDRATERGAYYRCGLRLTRCDRYPATVYNTGDFVIFSLPQRGVFAKLSSDDRITDVAARGSDVFISRGKCTSASPPSQGSLRSQ